MLIFTDETSHKYRRELNELEALRGKAHDGDALVKQAIAASGDDSTSDPPLLTVRVCKAVRRVKVATAAL